MIPALPVLSAKAKLIAGLIALAVVLGLVLAILNFIDGTWATTAGVDKGRAQVVAEYAERDNKQLREVIAEKERLQREKEALELQNQQLVADADQRYQEGLRDGKTELDAAVAAVHAGYRLRDPGARGAAKCDRAGASAAGAGTGGSDAAPAAYLSQAASDFLLRLAAEADDVVRQLTACQRIVEADRR